MNFRHQGLTVVGLIHFFLALLLSSPISASPRKPMCDPNTPVTRAFIESLFSAVALDNFGASFATALSDNLVWTVTGSSPIAGRYEGKQVYLDEVLTPLRAVLESLPVPIVEHVIVDGKWCTVVWRSEGVRGKNGADYDMKYAWVMRVEDEGVMESQRLWRLWGFMMGRRSLLCLRDMSSLINEV